MFIFAVGGMVNFGIASADVPALVSGGMVNFGSAEMPA